MKRIACLLETDALQAVDGFCYKLIVARIAFSISRERLLQTGLAWSLLLFIARFDGAIASKTVFIRERPGAGVSGNWQKQLFQYISRCRSIRRKKKVAEF